MPIIRVALSAALLLAAGACAQKNDKERHQQTPEAGYVVIRAEPVTLTTTLAGRTTAYQTAEVRPQVGGIIQARLFEEGQLVRAGQPLYQIDPSLFRAAEAQARANLASAEAARESAAALVQRYKPLAAMEAVSKQDYTNAVAAAGQADAAVAQQRAALRTASINAGYSRITAPITGRIGRSAVTAGALVTTGQADPLATIQRLDPIYVDIQQSSADLLRLRRDMAVGGVMPASANVVLTLEDGSRYGPTGKLEFAEVTVNAETSSVTLRSRFPNRDALLLPGTYVRATINQGARPAAILAPQAGISRDPTGNATALVIEADKAVLKTLKIDRTIGDKWLVLGGLKPGDKLIVEGLGKIKAGDKVVPMPAGSKPKPRKQGKGGGDKRDAK